MVEETFDCNLDGVYKVIGSDEILQEFLVSGRTLIILLAILGPIGAIIDLAVFFYAIYEIIVRINNFQKLENALKKIYDGEKVVLYETDFTIS